MRTGPVANCGTLHSMWTHLFFTAVLLLLLSACSSDDDMTPGDDDVTAGDDDATVGDDDTTSGDDDVTSGDDDTTSGDDDATVGDDDTTSGDDDVTSGDDDATSGDDDATVGDDDATSGDDDVTAGDDDATSGDDDVTAGDDDATSGDDDVTAGDDDSTSGDDDSTLGDDDSTSGDDDTPPGDDDVTATPLLVTPTPFVPIDEDGDGYPIWYQSIDTPENADCDDSDPDVNPSVERLIPEGWFWRGYDDDPHSSPMRQIYLSPYCMDVYPVTNIQFATFMNSRVQDGLGETTDDGLPLFDFDDNDDEIPERIVRNGQGGYDVLEGYDQHPVTEVYQWSGDAFCGAYGKRLPTEAEREKGARGVDTRDYPWGNEEPTCDLANYSILILDENQYLISVDHCVGDTTPVGSYPNASPFGLLDMTGNVAEFTSDFYQDDYYETSPDVDPQGPETGWATDPMNPDGFEAIVDRGGTWAAVAAPVWARGAEKLAANSNGVGFRCARDVPPAPEAAQKAMKPIPPLPPAPPHEWIPPNYPYSPNYPYYPSGYYLRSLLGELE